MVINVSFIDRNVKILFDKSKNKNDSVFSKITNVLSRKNTDNPEISQNNKINSFDKDEIFIKVLKKVEPIELPTNENEELSVKQLANIEAVKEYKEHIKKSKQSLEKCLIQKEDSPQNIANLTFDLDNSENIEMFLNNIFSLDEYFSKNFVTDSKKIKKSLVLPDEIIGFDTLTIPAFSPLKTNSNVKLKLSLDFKDFDNLNLKFKQILKVKPNVSYSIQFVKKRIINEIIVRFKNLGVNFKNINFYSSCLADFYSSKLRLSKHNSIIVRVDEHKTTILV